MVCRCLLVWKYFFKQKWEEIYDHFEEWAGPYFGISMFIAIVLQTGWIPIQGGDYWEKLPYEPISRIMGTIGLSIIGFWIVIGLICLVIITYAWLYENWVVANARADREIKKLRKQEKLE